MFYLVHPRRPQSHGFVWQAPIIFSYDLIPERKENKKTFELCRVQTFALKVSPLPTLPSGLQKRACLLALSKTNHGMFTKHKRNVIVPDNDGSNSNTKTQPKQSISLSLSLIDDDSINVRWKPPSRGFLRSFCHTWIYFVQLWYR